MTQPEPEAPKMPEPELENEHEEEVLFRQIEPVAAPAPAQEQNDQQMPQMDSEPKIVQKVHEPKAAGTDAVLPQSESKPEVTSPEPAAVNASPAPVLEEEKVEAPKEENEIQVPALP